MSPRPDVSEKRKDQILDAASEIFAEKGVHESRMDDIVEKTGLSKGALYWYFKSKDEILIGIFDRMFNREFTDLEKIQLSDVTATEKISIFTERALKDLGRMFRLMPLAYEFLSLAFRRKFVQDALKRYINRYLVTVENIIQQGIQSGEFRQVNPSEVAIALGAIFEGTILLWVYDNTKVRPVDHIRTGTHILLDGIKSES